MATQTREEEEQDLEEFRTLHPAEQRVRHYRLSRSTSASVLETSGAIGALVKEVARNTEAMRDLTLAERQSAIAVRAFTEAFSLARGTPAASKPRSIPPPMRDKLPSYLELREEDTKALTEWKEKAAADRVEMAMWARWGRRVVFVASVLGALGVIGGVVWFLVQYVVSHAR